MHCSNPSPRGFIMETTICPCLYALTNVKIRSCWQTCFGTHLHIRIGYKLQNITDSHTQKKGKTDNYRVSVLNSNVSYRICWGAPQLTLTGEDAIMFLLKVSVLCGRKLEFCGYLVAFTTFFQLSHVLPCILSLLLAVSTCTWMCDAGRNFTIEAPTYQRKHLHNNLHKATNTSGNQFVQAAKAQRPNQPLLPSLLKEGRAEEGWQRSSCSSAGSCSQAGNSHQLPEPHFILSLP